MDYLERSGKVVVGVDGSDGSRAAAAWALDEARRRGAELEVVYSWQMPALAYSAPAFVAPTAEEVDQEGHDLLASALSGLDAGDVKVSLVVREGPPAEALQLAASEPDVRLLVVGCRGHGGVTELLLGSVTHALSHRHPVPLVIVPRATSVHPVDPHARIVAGVDGSPESLLALRWAAGAARLREVPLRAVTAWQHSRHAGDDPPPGSGSLPTKLQLAAADVLAAAVEGLGDIGVPVERAIVEGPPARVLVDEAARAQLLVIGGRGHGRAREVLFGSVGHACTHRSPVPLALVNLPADGARGD